MSEDLLSQDVVYWRSINSQTSDIESVRSIGAWLEADKLDESDDNDN